MQMSFGRACMTSVADTTHKCRKQFQNLRSWNCFWNSLRVGNYFNLLVLVARLVLFIVTTRRATLFMLIGTSFAIARTIPLCFTVTFARPVSLWFALAIAWPVTLWFAVAVARTVAFGWTTITIARRLPCGTTAFRRAIAIGAATFLARRRTQ